MDIRQLENFLAVYDELNFARAAEKRYITRQAIRKSVSLLEKEGNTLLFRLEHNRLIPTEAAKKLEKKARSLVKAFRKLEKEYAQQNARKTITIGVDQSLYPLGIQIFMPTIQEFQNQYPDITLLLQGKDVRSLQKEAEQGSLDFGIMMDTAALMPFDVPVSLSLGKLMLFMTKKVRGRGGKTDHLSILDQKRLLLPGRPEEYRWIQKLLEVCSERGIRTDSFEYEVPAEKMVYQVRYEDAVGFGGSPDPLTAPPGTTTVLIPDFSYEPSFCLFRRKERELREEEQVFIDFLRKAPWPHA